MRKYYYHNRYDNDESKPFRLYPLLVKKLIVGTAILLLLIESINPLIESQLINTEPNSFLVPITDVIIQNTAESIFFLEASLFLWWIYLALLLIYYSWKPDAIYSLGNREIRSMGNLTPVWTDLLHILLSALYTYFFH